MYKINRNAIFFSKSNIDLGYEVKKYLKEYSINLMYAINVVELIGLFKGVKVEIVFLDRSSCEPNSPIIDFISSFPGEHKPVVVYIINDNEEKSDICSNKHISFVINENNFKNEFNKIENEIDFMCESNHVKRYDFCEVSTYLTGYLLKLGIAPKHIGFMYIKQAIDIALKNNENLGSLSKNIYPKVASINKTVAQNVERNIRNSIDCAVKNCTSECSELNLLNQNGKISNRAFLTFVLDNVISLYSKR